MKRIEAIVGLNELGAVREALREIGIRTMRVTDVEEEMVPVLNLVAGRKSGPEPGHSGKAKISVVVSDKLADRVILMLLANLREGVVYDGGGLVSSIEHVVRLEAEGFFEDVI
ncbi:MAG: P-II family nitrogen regulator [Bacteroidetes bacterium]|nr:P-II family nitrogen regulator [Bacteroidota bacterium]